jgi:low temperature requirement protein LtrA
LFKKILFIFAIDELSHKLKLVKEVSLKLSKSTDQKVVMWVLDSFSTLVSNALNPHESKVAYAGMISMLFDLNTSIIPIAVCSSATTAGALSESLLS